MTKTPKPPAIEIQKIGGGWGAPPWTWSGADYAGRTISIEIDFNETTGALTGAVTHRDDGCLFTRLLFGVGQDGSPENAPHQITCPAGDRNVPAGQLHAVGLDSMSDVLAGQITAGLPPAG